MSYTPTIWTNGGPPSINAARLQKLEDGLRDAADVADAALPAATARFANVVLAGPVAGGAAPATFRPLVAADLPAHGHDASAIAGLATVATTGAYGSLTGLPTLGTAAAQDASAFATVGHTHPTLAPLASPAFTGAPTAPTPGSSDNSTRLATAEWVRARLAELVASSPATLDTLNELAAALGNDPNFATTMSTALGNRLRVDAAQGLTSGQQLQALTNLGSSAAGRSMLAAADAAAQRTLLGAAAAGGLATLGGDGKVPTAQLPASSGFSQVDADARYSQALGRLSSFVYWKATGGGGTQMTYVGHGGPSWTGTLTGRSPGTTSLLTSTPRVGVVSTATAGSSAGAAMNWMPVYRAPVAGFGGGFRNVWKFGVGDAATVADARMFVGLGGTGSLPGNVNPSTLANIVGLGCDAGETTLSILHNDGSGTATKINLGASFPSQTLASDLYRLTIWCDPQDAGINYVVERLNTGDTASGRLTSDIPAGNQPLGALCWRNNGTTALAVALEFVAMSLEREN